MLYIALLSECDLEEGETHQDLMLDFYNNKRRFKIKVMDKLRVGQRINDDSLGYGVIVKIIQGTSKKVFAYMVMYEREPPKEYNGGVNPCLRWGSDLSVV